MVRLRGHQRPGPRVEVTEPSEQVAEDLVDLLDRGHASLSGSADPAGSATVDASSATRAAEVAPSAPDPCRTDRSADAAVRAHLSRTRTSRTPTPAWCSIRPVRTRSAPGSRSGWWPRSTGPSRSTDAPGPLGGAADRVAFRRLRDACDAILVGAGTVRAEDYGPPRAPADRAAARAAAGLAPAPQLLVVTRSADLDPRRSAVHGAAGRGGPCAGRDHPTRRRQADAVEALASGGRGRDRRRRGGRLPPCCAGVASAGSARVLCEGGPALERGARWPPTWSTRCSSRSLRCSSAGTPAVGSSTDPTLAAPVRPRLVELREHEGELLLRYRTVRGRSTGRRVTGHGRC